MAKVTVEAPYRLEAKREKMCKIKLRDLYTLDYSVANGHISLAGSSSVEFLHLIRARCRGSAG